MIQIPGFPDYYVDGTEIVSMKFGKRKVRKCVLDKAGYETINLYMHGDVFGKKVHRLIAQAYLADYSEDLEVDHIDRNKTNNNISNLRMITHSGNQQNTNANGYYYDKIRNKWLAEIRADGKCRHIGRFNTEEEARAAYLAEKIKLHPYYTPEVT